MTQPPPSEPQKKPAERPEMIPYATARTGRVDGPLVPLVSGFLLVGIGVLTLVVGRSGGSYSGRDGEATLFIDSIVMLIAIGILAVGMFIIFRALRKYDW